MNAMVEAQLQNLKTANQMLTELRATPLPDSPEYEEAVLYLERRSRQCAQLFAETVLASRDHP